MGIPTLTSLLRLREPYERHCRAVKGRIGLGHATRADITRSDLGSFVSIYAHRRRRFRPVCASGSTPLARGARAATVSLALAQQLRSARDLATGRYRYHQLGPPVRIVC